MADEESEIRRMAEIADAINAILQSDTAQSETLASGAKNKDRKPSRQKMGKMVIRKLRSRFRAGPLRYRTGRKTAPTPMRQRRK